MKIFFTCHICAHVMQTDSVLSGFTVKCKNCEEPTPIPLYTNVGFPHFDTVTADDVLPQPTRVFDVFSPAPLFSKLPTIIKGDGYGDDVP